MAIAADESKKMNILVVEDNPIDVMVTKEALSKGQHENEVFVVSDGVEAMQFLNCAGRYAEAPRPDIILLDLNLPKKDGREVLADIKSDPELRSIPVIILSTSKAEEDIFRSYDLHANCFVTKPVDLDQFVFVVQSIQDFWFRVVKLPTN